MGINAFEDTRVGAINVEDSYEVALSRALSQLKKVDINKT